MASPCPNALPVCPRSQTKDEEAYTSGEPANTTAAVAPGPSVMRPFIARHRHARALPKRARARDYDARACCARADIDEARRASGMSTPASSSSEIVIFTSPPTAFVYRVLPTCSQLFFSHADNSLIKANARANNHKPWLSLAFRIPRQFNENVLSSCSVPAAGVPMVS